MAFLTPEDLAPFATIEPAKAAAMIEDAEGLAALAAPCITNLEFLARTELAKGLKAILRGAILRWNDAGTGAVTQQQAGPFGQSIDTRNPRKSMFWPSEIVQLQDLCAAFNDVKSEGAFSVDTAPAYGSGHLPWCSINFGAAYCSCGADIAGAPIFEGA